MPRLAIFVAAAKAWLGDDHAAVHERCERTKVAHLDTYIEATVAVNHRGIVTVEFCAFFVAHEHRDLGAITARHVHLLSLNVFGF